MKGGEQSLLHCSKNIQSLTSVAAMQPDVGNRLAVRREA